MGNITVFLADWQVLFREGVHFTLSGEEDIEVIAEATNNEKALAFIEANPPDVAILNINHDKISGVEVTRRLQQNFPSVGVILIMDSDNEEQLFSALKSGARACLTKDTDPDDMVNILREVIQGSYPISEALLRPGIASRVLDEFEVFYSISEQVDNLLARLSPGENKILRHIADGISLQQVVEALDISEQVISHQLDLIRTKLVSNEHNRQVIEATLNRQPSIISRAGKPAAEYVTRDEFTAFKESLREHFRSLLAS